MVPDPNRSSDIVTVFGDSYGVLKGRRLRRRDIPQSCKDQGFEGPLPLGLGDGSRVTPRVPV